MWKRSQLSEFQVNYVKVLRLAIMKHHQRVHMAVYKPAKTKTPDLYVNSQQEILKKTTPKQNGEYIKYRDKAKLFNYNLISNNQKLIMQ